MKIKSFFNLFAILFFLVLSGCTFYNKNAVTIETGKWEFWEGRGKASVSPDNFIYEPASLQDEEYDYDIEGRGPALIAAKRIQGKKWVLEMKPAFFSLGRSYSRLTVGLWFGNKGVRPSLGSKEANTVLSVSCTRGENPGDYKTFVEIRNAQGKKIEILPNNLTFLKFERKNSNVTVYYSTSYRPEYEKSVSVKLEGNPDARFISGARYDGKAYPGEKLRIIQFNLNGRNFLE